MSQELTVLPHARQLNEQPAEPPDMRAEGSLDVHSVFRTIQGEGPFAGQLAVFVRLAGCTLLCPACDSEYTSNRTRYDVTDLVGLINEVGGGSGQKMPKLVVLTGGEPLRQNVLPLIKRLGEMTMVVQIETNGTMPFVNWPIGPVVVCSPKTERVHPSVVRWADHWKYVLSHDAVSEDGLPSSSLLMPKPPYRPTAHSLNTGKVWVQPADVGDEGINRLNMEAAVRSCLKFGYRLCLQQHKLAGVP